MYEFTIIAFLAAVTLGSPVAVFALAARNAATVRFSDTALFSSAIVSVATAVVVSVIAVVTGNLAAPITAAVLTIVLAMPLIVSALTFTVAAAVAYRFPLPAHAR